jgi:putative hemolysin
MSMPADRDFSTVAGFALSVLKQIPATGERFEHAGWRFEVVDMDGRKIDKLIAYPPKHGKREKPIAIEAPLA